MATLSMLLAYTTVGDLLLREILQNDPRQSVTARRSWPWTPPWDSPKLVPSEVTPSYPSPSAVLTSSTVVCCQSVAKLCLTLWDPVHCSTPGFPVLHWLLEFAETRVYRVDDAIHSLILHLPLFLLPSIFPSIRVFSNELTLRIRSRVVRWT